MACPVSNLSRTRRTIVQLGLECTHGTAVENNTKELALYESFNPVQPQFDVVTLNRAKGSLSPDGAAPAIGRYALTGTVYVAGSGVKNIPPAWMWLLRASGFGETRYVDTAVTAPVGALTSATPSITGGNMAAGAYKYKISVVKSVSGDLQESLLIAVTATATVASGNTGSVVLDWSATGDADLTSASTKKRVYRTHVGATGTYYFVGETLDATSFTDTLDDHELADPEPTESASLTGVWYEPIWDEHDSLTVQNWLDSRKLPASGSRGSINFSGDAGQLMQGAFDLQGIYTASTKVANPATPILNPSIPPRICNSAFTITPQGGAARTVIFKSVGIDLGTQTSDRLDGNATECLKEIGIYNEFNPRWTTTIEVEDGTIDWVEEFKSATKYKLDMTIKPSGTPAAGTQVQFTSEGDATNYAAQLISAPQFNDSDGLRTWDLEFQLIDYEVAAATKGNFLKIHMF